MKMSPALFHYRVYGLTLSSEIELVDFPKTEASADVTIVRGSVPHHLDAPVVSDALFEASPDSYLLTVPGTARYWVRWGREVVLDVDPSASATDVGALLAGPVLTALLHQRGALVLHAAGVVGAAGAVLIAGHSGHGKSTLLAGLVSHGFRVLTDDVAAVTMESGCLMVHPGIPRVRLWQDAAQRLGHSPANLARAWAGIEKFVLPLSAQFEPDSQPLAQVYILSFSNCRDVHVERIVNGECFDTVRTQTRNLRVVEGLRMHASHFRLAAAVADRVPMFRLTRPRGLDSLPDLIALMRDVLQ